MKTTKYYDRIWLADELDSTITEANRSITDAKEIIKILDPEDTQQVFAKLLGAQLALNSIDRSDYNEPPKEGNPQ